MIWQVQVDLACLIMWLWLSKAAAVISEPEDFEGGPHYVDRSWWVSKSTRAATRQILRPCIWQQHSCLIGTTVCLSGCGVQQYWWFGYTGLTWSQLWPMAFMRHWFVLSTVARYPLLCVNVITALRVIWHLSAACSSDYSIVEINIVVCNFKVALSLLQPARCSSILMWCYCQTPRELEVKLTRCTRSYILRITITNQWGSYKNHMVLISLACREMMLRDLWVGCGSWRNVKMMLPIGLNIPRLLRTTEFQKNKINRTAYDAGENYSAVV